MKKKQRDVDKEIHDSLKDIGKIIQKDIGILRRRGKEEEELDRKTKTTKISIIIC
jgi:hypothetical protein